MNPFTNHSLNSLPPLKQLATKKLEDCWSWSEVYVCDHDSRFDGVWIKVRVRFSLRRGRVVRAFVNGLKSGDGVLVLDGNCYVRKPVVGKMIGQMLWERIVKARGRRSDYDSEITRSELVYCAYYPDCDLRGKEIHHKNCGTSHALWQLAVVDYWNDCVAVAGLGWQQLLPALDDRPGNLIALTPRQHWKLHNAMGTLYYGNYDFDGRDCASLDAGLLPFQIEGFSTNRGICQFASTLRTHCREAELYDGVRRSFICAIGRSYYRAVIISSKARLKSRKGDSSLASMQTPYRANMKELRCA